MRVSAAGNMPLQGLVKPPAKPVVMIVLQAVYHIHTVNSSRFVNFFAILFAFRRAFSFVRFYTSCTPVSGSASIL